MKKAISILLVLSLTAAAQVPIFAASQLQNTSSYTKEIDGIIYSVTDEYDDSGIRHITYNSKERTITGSDDGETMTIIAPEGTYTFNSPGKIKSVEYSREIQPMRAAYCVSDTAIGYSGTIFTYSNYNWSRVTLGVGGESKSGAYNNYAAGFYNEMLKMGQIYSSMNGLQQAAWFVLRVYGFLGSLSLDAIDIILSIAGIDLKGQLEATILGLNNWYEAEQNARNYFKLYR